MSVLRFPQGTSLPEPGSLVDQKYRLEELLGEGVSGAVYRAVHVGLEKSFAIKFLRTAPSPDALASFRGDAGTLGRLLSPHIAEVTDLGIDGSGIPYVVTELVQGTPLSDLCRSRGAMPLAEALPLLRQIAGALDNAHDAGVLHRDLKPGNVFVCSDDPESPAVKVVDFGLAALLAGPEPKGTPQYLAPERIRQGQASRASDIYSFGVLAYKLLGGKPPFRGTEKEILAGHLEAAPPPLPLPPEVWRPLRATLQKDPSLRPATAGEVVRRLEKATAETQVSKSPAPLEAGPAGPTGNTGTAGPRMREQAPEPRKNVGLIAAVVCCAVLLGVVGFLIGRGRGPAEVADQADVAGNAAGTREITVGKDLGPKASLEIPEPAVPRMEEPAEPQAPVAPTSPGVTFGFNDIEQACGDLSSLPNYLCLVNRGSEPVAGGARLVLDETLASFTGRTNFGNAISISVAGKERYSLDFGPAKGRALLPGLYTGAVRWPFNDGPYPGIDVTVGSSGCNTEEGKFRILQIQVTGDNKIQRFVADFETTCNGALGRISVGQGPAVREPAPTQSLPVT